MKLRTWLLAFAALTALPMLGDVAPASPPPRQSSSPLIDEVLSEAEVEPTFLDATEADRKVQEELIEARVEQELSGCTQ
jgi:hypothetical protein